MIFVVVVILAVVVTMIGASKNPNAQNLTAPIFSYLSPTVGFLCLLAKQIGETNAFGFYGRGLDSFMVDYGTFISMGVQLVLSVVLVFISAHKLNPLNSGFRFRRKRKKS